MKDIDLKAWAEEIKGKEETPTNPASPEHNIEELSGKKAHKTDDNQNLNMPKKTNYGRSSKYQQLEKIDEI